MGQKKTCVVCNKEYPASAEYFRRSGVSEDGLAPSCKTCSKEYVKQYYLAEANVKGVLGFRCPLWALRCGECRTVTRCWRLEKSGWETVDERPAKLRSDPVFTKLKPKHLSNMGVQNETEQ